MDMTASDALFMQSAPLPQPDADTALYANRVEKTYANGTHALDEVRLRIQKGEFISLLGPSGCGKSTLLRMFAGLDTPSAGRILWWGSEHQEGGDGAQSLSMVFQEPTLMPWARVRANTRLPLDLRKVPAAQAEARVTEALRLVGLDGFADAWPRELSGGMQMRVSLARALVTSPSLLLLDEPFGALDEFTRNRLDSEVRDLWAKQGMTVVFVTHSIYEAVFLSTRVVVMAARPGRVIADVAIDGPQQRDDDWRVSAPFLDYCRQLSELLTTAAQGQA